MGLEPTTFSLATRRSTTELCPLVLLLLKIIAFLRLSKSLKVKTTVEICLNCIKKIKIGIPCFYVFV